MVAYVARKRSSRVAACTLVVACAVAPNASAAILDIRADVSLTVQELLDGQAGSVTRDTAAFDQAGLPITAETSLVSTDLGDRVLALGTGVSAVADPRRLQQANPAEFGLEAACFSNRAGQSYRITAEGRETRTLVFSSDGAIDPQPIDFSSGGTREIESELFLGGALLFWSVDASVPLDEVLAELTVRIVREDTGDVLAAVSVTVRGDPFEESSLTVEGPIAIERGSATLLATGAPAELLDALGALDAAADTVVVLLPFQSHTYTFTARENEEFDVSARFTIDLRNAPDGTGLAAVWGRPFENLATVIESAIPGTDGLAVQAAANRALRPLVPGTPDTAESAPETSPQPTSGGLCGVLGAESGVALMPLLWVTRRRGGGRRGRRTRRT
jgi:hypothetical protein